MSIEGLGKKFQDARSKRGLTLDEAARMTKIRPSRLAEIEADDFSNFPSLAYAKGFLLIYGKFLDVDVSEFMEAFEGSEQVTVDGYSYLQDAPPPKPSRSPVLRRSTSNRTSFMPFLIGVVVIVLGFMVMKFILNILRVAPRQPPPAQTQIAQPAPIATAAPTATATPTPIVMATPAPRPSLAETPRRIAEAPSILPSATVAPTATPIPTRAPALATAPVPSPSPKATKEPEVRRAEPVRAEDLAKATTAAEKTATPVPAPATTVAGQNSVAIRPLRRTYIKVVVDNEARTPAFERWIAPSDGTVEFKGQHIDVRVLDREAVQIRKNGKTVADGDTDVTVE
jgi:cytoskeletal protein RodZ